MGVGYNPKIVTDGLVLCLDAANPKSYNYNIVTYSQDFTNAAYSKSTGLISATGVLAPDSTLTATTMTDDDAANWESFGRSFTVPNDSTSYNISIYIRKTTGATSTRTGFNVSFTGGTTKSYNIRFNADTGVAAGGDSNLVTSENNNFWRLSFTVSNNSTGNTSLNISYYPATGIYDGGDVTTATGSHTVWGFQVTRGATLLPYLVNTTYSDLILYDLSGNVKNGTLINGPTYIRSNNGYMNFDGVDDHVIINQPNIQTSPNRFSIEFVLYPIGTDFILVSPYSAGLDHFIRYDGANQRINFQVTEVADLNNRARFSTTNSVPLNAYTHIVCTMDNLDLKIYINGILNSSFTETIAIANWDNLWHIGQRANDTFRFNGRLPLIKVYNRTLTASEIQQNFNAARGRFGI